MDFECESMLNEDYRIIVKNDTMIKCFRDGRIFTKFIHKDGREKWIERINKPGNHGYIEINIGGIKYLAHRLIMEAFSGESQQQVDHIDRNKTNNNFENLRYCTASENGVNKDCVDNAKGYYLCKKSKKWKSQISIVGKVFHLGFFENEEDAHQAYLQASQYRHRK